MMTRLWPLCAIIFALTTPASADREVMCKIALKHADKINAEQPIEVDSATNTTAALASCAARTLVIQRQINLKHARMEDDFKEFLTKQIQDHSCADKLESALSKSGWTIRYENAFKDGPVVKINVKCSGAN